MVRLQRLTLGTGSPAAMCAACSRPAGVGKGVPLRGDKGALPPQMLVSGVHWSPAGMAPG